MIKAARLACAAGAAAALLAGITPSAAAADSEARSGTTAQSRNGLTCTNTWFNTSGGTDCKGTSAASKEQLWRLRVACSFQPDHTGIWQSGPGSDRFECRSSVQSTSVEFG
ncbi:hypothetical protein NLX83_02725 [Allokutzneria sp. A3M-2-11 16]|uniref:hypothetical protein n=1 Tax=Allokutzneria sp. A3M-2-11 16 TaxID=2962043 RepID=UPI0020B70A93|nr:hypothetical protein [Allokutzneria sp. A3M-2-11 16]MCP3798163.1 hypothetical protein [Allokutzneria sp. A3M-2-11 16]